MSDKMVEKLTEKLTKIVSRRGILASLTAGAAALASSLLGKANASAATLTFACCHLCGFPGNCSNCNCTWSWNCNYQQGPCREIYTCIECYMVSFPCDGRCTNVKCSDFRHIGTAC